jgi:hypothetical protein
MRLISIIVLPIVLLLGSLSRSAVAAPEAEFQINVKGRIDIGPDGAVRDYSVDGATPKAVKALVDKAVRGWRFEPIVEGGRAVTATTTMGLELTAVPLGEDFQLRIDEVHFGVGMSANKMKPPMYPSDLMRQHVDGTVVLVLAVDAQGKVTATHAERVDLGRLGTPAQMEAWRERLARVAQRAAADWTFAPIDFVDGKPVAMNVRVPVDFRLGGPGWKKLYRGPDVPAPFVQYDRVVAADVESGDAPVALDSRFRLRDNVIGKAL